MPPQGGARRPNYGVRKYTYYNAPVLEDKAQMIGDALDVFLAGFEQISDRTPDRRRTPLKAIG
jgi:hypothetical protein